MRILQILTARFVSASPTELSPDLQVTEALRAATLEAFDRYCHAPCGRDPWLASPVARRHEAAAVAARIRLEHLLTAAE